MSLTTRVLAGLVACAALLSGCSTIDGVKKDAQSASEVANACSGAMDMGTDLVEFAKDNLGAAAVGFENLNDLIDAVTTMDEQKLYSVRDKMAEKLEPTDAKQLRENVDRYGEIVKKCRLGLEAQEVENG